jgi:diguanylate cyclase (GGDEF)-like protein
MDESQKIRIKCRGVARFGVELRDVREYPFRHRDIQPLGRTTVSAGIAAYPEDGTSYDEILRKADQALYTAMRTGRNRLCLAGDPVAAGPDQE